MSPHFICGIKTESIYLIFPVVPGKAWPYTLVAVFCVYFPRATWLSASPRRRQWAAAVPAVFEALSSEKGRRRVDSRVGMAGINRRGGRPPRCSPPFPWAKCKVGKLSGSARQSLLHWANDVTLSVARQPCVGAVRVVPVLFYGDRHNKTRNLTPRLNKEIKE